jgi:hypothetical protein
MADLPYMYAIVTGVFIVFTGKKKEKKKAGKELQFSICRFVTGLISTI